MILPSQSSRRHIVVIGASAGGIGALQKLFANLPADSAASYFVVLHLSAEYRSRLDRILQATTSMRVMFATDQQPILPGSVYVAPPDRHLMLDRECVRVTRGPRECGSRPSVDVLFRSAALAFGQQVIGVVLSGSLDDGSAGLWQVKDRGGLAFVQDPQEAEHASMPASAMEQVDVDFIGTVAALATRITQEVGRDVTPVSMPPPLVRQQIENLIALGETAMQVGVMELGAPSSYTCPECGGTLAQIDEGPVVRFRCHTGHAYSFKSLLAEVNSSVDSSLWAVIRSIEERILILRQLADLAERDGRPDDAVRLSAQANLADQKCQPLRDLVLDTDFFASD